LALPVEGRPGKLCRRGTGSRWFADLTPHSRGFADLTPEAAPTAGLQT